MFSVVPRMGEEGSRAQARLPRACQLGKERGTGLVGAEACVCRCRSDRCEDVLEVVVWRASRRCRYAFWEVWSLPRGLRVASVCPCHGCDASTRKGGHGGG